MNVVVLKHLSNIIELAREDFNDIASNTSQILFGYGDFLLIAFFIEIIQLRLKLQCLFEGIEEIIHFFTVIEDDFLVFINIVIELFQFTNIAGFKLKHLLYN